MNLSEGEIFTYDNSGKKTACSEASGGACDGSMNCSDVMDHSRNVVAWSASDDHG